MSAPLIYEVPIEATVDMEVEALGSQEEPLGDRLRSLRTRLSKLANQMDVFIVVGGTSGTYSEDDILLVDKDALDAANQADQLRRDSTLEQTYQCSVCPMSFQNPNTFRDHMSLHPMYLEHSCWTCGNKYQTIEDLEKHRAEHDDEELVCYLCNSHFENVISLHKHNCGWRCPECRVSSTCRSALSRHMRMSHRDEAPFICDACFRPLQTKQLLKEHMLAHQRSSFVCGYENCVLRFSSRGLLVEHIQKSHIKLSAEVEEKKKQKDDSLPSVACEHCDQTFVSFAAMRRHSSIHRKKFNSERILRSAKKLENNDDSAMDTSQENVEENKQTEETKENQNKSSNHIEIDNSMESMSNNTEQEEFLEMDTLNEDAPK